MCLGWVGGVFGVVNYLCCLFVVQFFDLYCMGCQIGVGLVVGCCDGVFDGCCVMVVVYVFDQKFYYFVFFFCSNLFMIVVSCVGCMVFFL